MPTRLETILQALEQVLLATGIKVERNTPIPEEVPASGLIILRDGDPGEPIVTMSPLAYEYEHRAEVEVYVQKAKGREAVIDAAKTALGAAITADRYLGGTCDWIEAGAPETAAFALEGAAPMLSQRIPLTIVYVTTDPLA